MVKAKLADISSLTPMNDKTTIYADYQATTPLDPRVQDRMARFWYESFGNPHSSDHAVGWKAHEAVEKSATSVAKLIGADPDEIIFTSGATEANNLAVLGLARRAPVNRKRILITAIEHKCVLAAARALKNQLGFSVNLVPVDQNGSVNVQGLEETLDDDVLMVSVMAVNNEIGSIQNLPRIAEILAPYNIPLHCDAAQAPCGMDVSSLADYASMISISAHKMYGPPGVGALYIRRELQDCLEPIIHGGGQQGGLRSGTLPLPLCVGMAAAAELVSEPRGAQEREVIRQLRDRFFCRLSEAGAQLRLNGPELVARHPGNANLCFIGFDAQEILASLQPLVAASTGSACTTGIPEPSHVLQAMALTHEQCASSIRFSFGRFTTSKEIDSIVRMVLNTLSSLSATVRTTSQPLT